MYFLERQDYLLYMVKRKKKKQQNRWNLILAFIGPRHKERTLEQKEYLSAENLHSFASYTTF